MSNLLAIAISSGLMAALWVTGSASLQMSTFAGFLAWSTFFAVGGGKKGLKTALLTNISGACWAALTVVIGSYLASYLGSTLATAISTAIGSAMVVLQSKIKPLYFIPGGFIGLSAFFVSDANLMATILALATGAFLGIITENLGIILTSESKDDDAQYSID